MNSEGTPIRILRARAILAYPGRPFGHISVGRKHMMTPPGRSSDRVVGQEKVWIMVRCGNVVVSMPFGTVGQEKARPVERTPKGSCFNALRNCRAREGRGAHGRCLAGRFNALRNCRAREAAGLDRRVRAGQRVSMPFGTVGQEKSSIEKNVKCRAKFQCPSELSGKRSRCSRGVGATSTVSMPFGTVGQEKSANS